MMMKAYNLTIYIFLLFRSSKIDNKSNRTHYPSMSLMHTINLFFASNWSHSMNTSKTIVGEKKISVQKLNKTRKLNSITNCCDILDHLVSQPSS
jgi:hypothetical protein